MCLGTSLCEFYCYLSLPYSTVIFTYLHMFNSRYVTATIIPFIGSRQNLLVCATAYRSQPVFRHCLFCVLSVFLVAAVAAVQFFSGPSAFTSPRRQLPLLPFASVAFCNQACSAWLTATTVRSRPSLTHPLTLPAITCFAPRRSITTCSHHSTCDQQRCVCCLYILHRCCYSCGTPRYVRPAVFHPSTSAVV